MALVEFHESASLVTIHLPSERFEQAHEIAIYTKSPTGLIMQRPGRLQLLACRQKFPLLGFAPFQPTATVREPVSEHS